jgi:peptidoglycan/LPS O-acetylase OafA/YrhL
VALGLSTLTVQYASSRPGWLETPVLLRLAEVSFGLYLWHYVFVRSDIPLWAALLLTIVATAASWHLVEQPVLRWAASLRGGSPSLRPAAQT